MPPWSLPVAMPGTLDVAAAPVSHICTLDETEVATAVLVPRLPQLAAMHAQLDRPNVRIQKSPHQEHNNLPPQLTDVDCRVIVNATLQPARL